MKCLKIIPLVFLCALLVSCDETNKKNEYVTTNIDSEDYIGSDLVQYSDFVYNKTGHHLFLEDEQGVIYKLGQNANNYVACDYICDYTDKDIIIKSQIEGLNVEEVGNFAFYKSEINSIILPSTISIIGRNSFDSSTLKSISGLNNVTILNESAFSNCDLLEKIEFSDKLKYVYFNSLAKCDNLKCVNLPDALVYLDKYFATGSYFYEKNLVEDDNFTYFHKYLMDSKFGFCSSTIRDDITTVARDVYLSSGNYTSRYSTFEISKNSKLKYFDGLQIYNNSETYILNGTLVYANPNDDLTKYEFDTIASHALRNCESFTASNTLTTIMSEAFDDSAHENFAGWKVRGITSNIDLSQSKIEYIPSYAFYIVEASNVKLPRSLKYISKNAFELHNTDSLNLYDAKMEEFAVCDSIINESVQSNLYFLFGCELSGCIFNLKGDNLSLILWQKCIQNYESINNNEYYCEYFSDDITNEIKCEINSNNILLPTNLEFIEPYMYHHKSDV